MNRYGLPHTPLNYGDEGQTRITTASVIFWRAGGLASAATRRYFVCGHLPIPGAGRNSRKTPVEIPVSSPVNRARRADAA